MATFCGFLDMLHLLIFGLMQFFEMPRHEAVKALDIYKRAGQQVIMFFHILTSFSK